MTTKVHAAADGLGNPLRFLLSSGNRNDICMAQTLLEPFDLNGKLILADKGYDSDKFIHWLEEQGGIAVIPSRITEKDPRKTDWYTYKERHLVENLFLKLKNNRRFATRYEKKAFYFRAVVCLACTLSGYFDGFKKDFSRLRFFRFCGMLCVVVESVCSIFGDVQLCLNIINIGR